MRKESKHVINFRNSHLKSGESIISWANGYIGEAMGKGDKTQHNVVLLVTNTQVAFHRKGFLGEVLETMPLKKNYFYREKITLRFSNDCSAHISRLIKL